MKELINLINQIGTINIQRGLTVEVKILDVRKSYGKIQYQVSPTRGSGATWVENVNDIK